MALDDPAGPATDASAGPTGSDVPAPGDLAGSGGDFASGGDSGIHIGQAGAGVGQFGLDAGQAGDVTRTVEVDAALEDVWQAVADPAERALWLDDPDALARHVRVDESSPGQRLVWTWWRPGDEGDASTVSVVLSPVDGGGTRVVVTETLPATPPVFASAQAAATSPTAVLRRAHGARLGRRDLWRSRLLGLELLFVAASVAVA